MSTQLSLTWTLCIAILAAVSWAQTCDPEETEGCKQQVLSAYYQNCYGYDGCAIGTLSGHSGWCYGYRACREATMTEQSGVRCFGPESCKMAQITTIYATCDAWNSCQLAKFTQTANSHPVACMGTGSCGYAEFRGTNGLKVYFVGHQSAQRAKVYCTAGQTCYVTCGPKHYYAEPHDEYRLIDPQCEQATIYAESGANVVTDCPDGQACFKTGEIPAGVTLDEFMRQNREKDPMPQDLIDEPTGEYPDGWQPPQQPAVWQLSTVNMSTMFAVIAVISTILNCYLIAGKSYCRRSAGGKKVVYSGVAHTDQSDVELM